MNLTNRNEIEALLKRHGFRFSKSMGQNFLTESWVPSDIADSCLAGEEDGVLEIGPGIGCLTVELAQRAGQVVSVELDESLRPILADTLSGRENVSIVFGDAMKLDLPVLCRETGPNRVWRVCANLPYNVTTPILTALLETRFFENITVMIQKEVAQRICARPGTAEYGAFTVLVQWYSTPELLFEVPKECFLPQPKVTSAVIRLNRRPVPPAEIPDEDFFFKVVRAAFGMRRKTLANALSAGLGIARSDAESCITGIGLSPTIRGEALSTEQFAALSGLLWKNQYK